MESYELCMGYERYNCREWALAYEEDFDQPCRDTIIACIKYTGSDQYWDKVSKMTLFQFIYQQEILIFQAQNGQDRSVLRNENDRSVLSPDNVSF